MQPDMNQLFQSMQKMQQEVIKIQQELENTFVEGSAGNGAVTIKCNGNMSFKSVKIAPELINPEERETLEDLITIAINDALGKCQSMAEQKMGKTLGNASTASGIPGFGPSGNTPPSPPSIGF